MQSTTQWRPGHLQITPVGHSVKGPHLSRTRPGRSQCKSPTQHGTGGRSQLKGSKRYRVLDSVTAWPAWTWSMLDRIAGPCGTGYCTVARRMGSSRACRHSTSPAAVRDSRWRGASSRHPGRAQRRAPSCGHPEDRPTQESSGRALAPKGPGAPAPTRCATTPVGSTSDVHSQGTRPRRGGSRTQFAKRPDQPACACLGPQKKGGGATTVALVGFALWAKGRSSASGMDAEQEVQVLWRP